MDEYIQELVEDLGAKSYKKGIDWNGYNVYIPVYEGNPIIGLPYVILEKGEEIRVSTPDESLAYLDYELTKEMSDEPLDSLKQKATITMKD